MVPLYMCVTFFSLTVQNKFFCIIYIFLFLSGRNKCVEIFREINFQRATNRVSYSQSKFILRYLLSITLVTFDESLLLFSIYRLPLNYRAGGYSYGNAFPLYARLLAATDRMYITNQRILIERATWCLDTLALNIKFRLFHGEISNIEWIESSTLLTIKKNMRVFHLFIFF